MVGIRLPRNEHGFSLIESSLVFAMIVLLATAAGLVADKQSGSQSSQLKPNVIQLGTQPNTRTSTTTTTTLELGALGIDMTVPNAINDLTYAAPDSSGGYGISTKTLTADDAKCVATGSAPPLGYFFKEPGQYPGTASAPGRLAKQFADYYIAWNSSQTPCSDSSTVTTLANQQIQDLVGSFDTIEEIPAGS
jgi:type II secretory pathway pseudopilin PulG